MSWIDRMNAAMDYVEAHLREEVAPQEIARIMACPYPVFQRSFIQITGIPLSEYIRRRRLTCAAYDIRSTDVRIVDLALTYGYESPDAFAVAFKRLHGIAPAAARRPDTELKFFSRLYFTLSIKGVHEMDYKVIERDAFQVAGIRHTTPYGGGTWGIVKGDGSMEKMQNIAGSAPSLGLCFGFGEDGSNDYMVGFPCEGDVAAWLDRYAYPKAQWLMFTAEGSIEENALGATWGRIYGEFLPQSEYKQADLPTIENYLVWDEATKYCKVEIWIPIES